VQLHEARYYYTYTTYPLERSISPVPYDASAFVVLRGLDPVRTRPDMYTRTSSPTHIILEVIDNAADEALAGYATEIHVNVSASGQVVVADNGRGIPVGIPENETRPAVELAFSTLHAGSKFNKGSQENGYRFSGGLHGVGVAVTNALSRSLKVQVCTLAPNARSRYLLYQMAFTDGAITEPLTEVGAATKEERGTVITVDPDPKYFDSPTVNYAELVQNLRSKALLLPGLRVTLNYAGHEPLEWHYPNGFAGYIEDTIRSSGNELVGNAVYCDELFVAGHGEFADGEGAAWALAWTDGPQSGESFVNLIPTPAGGTHESGLRAGILDALTRFITHHGLMPAKIKLTQEDVTTGLSFLLSVKVLDPHFQGQTKEKLNNRSTHKLVAGCVTDLFELWLNAHPDVGKAIAEKVLDAAISRTRTVQKVERRKSSSLATLPGKLIDCQSDDVSRNELFLVEGNSASGTVKAGRDKDIQAILPLRGKILNAWEVSADLLFRNVEIHDISVALGVAPHTLDTPTDHALSRLRYGKVVILSDADVDGSHIQVLLITLFVRHFPRIVTDGHLWIAKPPLYRVDVTTKGTVHKIYAEDEAERDAIIDRYQSEGVKEDRIKVQRFKGLGEMNPDQLWETTMCADTRHLVPISFEVDEYSEVKDRLNVLMSKQTISARKAWIETEGYKATVDI
jgi:topoisomerase-4 subunit B